MKALYAMLFVSCVVVLFILYKTPSPETFEKTSEDIPKTSKEVLEKLYNQVKVIDDVCRSQNISYWLVSGSLLGCLRHGEIIPWDDDADVGIKVEDAPKLEEALRHTVRSYGMLLKRTIHGLKVFDTVDRKVGTDIFFYILEGDKWVIFGEEGRKEWPNDYFMDIEVEKLGRANFGPLIHISIPSNALRYLKTLYGSDCMKVARLYFDHLNDKKHDLSGLSFKL